MDQRRREILDRVDAMDSGRGVVVLTDMFGGTPSNLAISILDRPGVEVIAGVNLPMLIKLASVRVGGTLVEAAVAGRDAGRKYISIAPERSEERREGEEWVSTCRSRGSPYNYKTKPRKETT